MDSGVITLFIGVAIFLFIKQLFDYSKWDHEKRSQSALYGISFLILGLYLAYHFLQQLLKNGNWNIYVVLVGLLAFIGSYKFFIDIKTWDKREDKFLHRLNNQERHCNSKLTYHQDKITYYQNKHAEIQKETEKYLQNKPEGKFIDFYNELESWRKL